MHGEDGKAMAIGKVMVRRCFWECRYPTPLALINWYINTNTNRQILYKYEWPWARSWSLAASGSGAKQRWKEKARGAFVRTQFYTLPKNNRLCIVLLVKMGGSVRERYRIKCRSISALGDRCKSSAKIIFYQRSSLVIGFRFANRCLMI